MYKWVYVLASPEEAKNYRFKIRIDYGNEKQIIFEDEVSSLNDSHSSIIQDCDKAFSISNAKWHNLKLIHKVERYFLQIRNLKTEAKDEDEESGISDSEEN